MVRKDICLGGASKHNAPFFHEIILKKMHPISHLLFKLKSFND